MSKLTNLDEAQTLILNHSRLLPAESISMVESLGRVSAVDLFARTNLPAFAQSAVDGFALASLNTDDNKYLIIGNSQSDIAPTVLKPGQAMSVATGGMIPNGTIAVIPHEKAQIKDHELYPLEEVRTGSNIKRAGEDFSQAEQLISRGSIIGAGDISLLAAFGTTIIDVYRQPRVAVLCLSKNVIPWLAKPEPGQIRDSNGPLLRSLIIQENGLPVAFMVAESTSVSVKSTFQALLNQVDVLIITGGTYAEGNNEAYLLMDELGAEMLYWDIPIQPGSHTGASLWNSRLIFALSGNPAACAVGFHLFVAPALRAMQGLPSSLPRLTATCTNGFQKLSNSRRFVRGQLCWSEKGWQVTVLPGQKPSMIRSLIHCNALIDIPAESPPIDAGEEVSVIALKPLI